METWKNSPLEAQMLPEPTANTRPNGRIAKIR